ncbi:MAG: cytochrome c biogenesis protein [Deferribacterales bacterium]
MLFDLSIFLYMLSFVMIGFYLFFNNERFSFFAKLFAILGTLLNGIYLVMKWILLPSSLSGNISYILSLITFILSLSAVIVVLRYKKISVLLFILPISIIFAIAAFFHQPLLLMRAYHLGFWLFVHLPLTIAGSSLFIVSAIFGIFYFIQEKQLKNKKFGFLYNVLPSLDISNRINTSTMITGFILFTGGLLSGFIWGIYEWEGKITFSPKLVFALITWFIFAMVIFIKKWKGLAPKGTALASIIGIISVIITYVALAFFIKG